MISIGFSVIDILMKVGTAAQRNVMYGTNRFQILRINCFNDNDVDIIQQRKGLNKRIL